MKTNTTKLLIVIILGIFLILIVAQNENDKTQLYRENNKTKLKKSNSDIIIITPENKTYLDPMSGYYPGTYGFENDEDNSIPEEWVDTTEENAHVKVIDNVDGHKKIVECYSSQFFDSVVNLENSFNQQTEGIIEFWWYQSSSETSAGIVRIYGESDDDLIEIKIDDKDYPGKIVYAGDNEINDTNYADYADDEWIHMRIEFNCTSDTWSLWINDMNFVNDINFKNNRLANYVNKIQFSSHDEGHSSLFYVDSVGYSWDPNYNVGDNLKPGLLLAFQSVITFDWIGYSLDAQPNITIMGNTSFSLPDGGTHRIQVFGNDSLGNNYYSSVRHFSVQFLIKLLTPENITYNDAMSGYYPGTYGFENDKDGTIPKQWNNVSQDNGTIEVVESWVDHNKALRIRGFSGMEDGQADNTFSSNQTSGIIEFYWGHNTTGASRLWVYNELNQFAMQIGLWYFDQLSYYNDSWQDIAPISTNTFHHIKLDFDCDTDTYDIYLDEVLVKNDAEFQNPSANVSKVRFNTDGDRSAYVDAVGYSWDPNYNVGDNLNEGLLLSFENTTTFDWMGYSLDGQMNKTILGNATIPVPTDGMHTIQVFGNTSSDVLYQSFIRYFCIDHIIINTPKDITYSRKMNYGYYYASYSFENDEDGVFPTGWIESGNPSPYYLGKTTVIASKEGHTKVMCMNDTRSDTRTTAAKVFPSEQLSGTVEFWIYFESDAGDRATDVRIENSGGSLLTVCGVYNNQWRYIDGTTPIDTGLTAVNEWFHVSIDFSGDGTYKGLSAEKYRVTIRRSDKSIYHQSPELDYFQGTTGKAARFSLTSWHSAIRKTWLDSVGYSWDPDYDIGDNLYNMAGYYPGTYGFENDEVGSIPMGWVDNTEPNANVKVIDELNGHKKVVECYSSGAASSQIKFNNYFNSRDNGTIEFWWQKSSTENSAALFQVWEGTNGWAIQIRMDLRLAPNTIAVNDGSGMINTPYDYADDKWIHMRIEFNCTSDKWSLWIDQVKYCDNIDLNGDVDNINRTRFWSYGSVEPTLYYVDGFGYSWDPNYDIGDNLKEGLLISFQNTTNLDWMAYSLDGQANRTIWGDTAFPLPADGEHTIQVFGNDTSGIIYRSEIRRFSVRNIYINTPENKTYKGPMSGYYPGTYGFENDNDNAFPAGWTSTYSGGTCQVISSLESHNKIVELYDDVNGALLDMKQHFSTPQTLGIVEFYLRSSNTSKQAYIFIYETDTNDGIYLRIEDNVLTYRDSTGDVPIGAISSDTWYHFSIEFNSTLDKFWISIDGVKYGGIGGYDYRDTNDGMNYLRISSGVQDLDYSIYIDAVGYSWDPNYDVGNNLGEGLLLDFENHTNLEWMAYSLDGQSNKTILGNISIPFPFNGFHSIQLFANDSSGAIYQSEIRHFSILVLITILTPENTTYTEPMSGYYPGTYGFENDKDGSDPQGFEMFHELGGDVSVKSSEDGHNKIILMDDTSESENLTMRQYFVGGPRTNGTIEFWLKSNQASNSLVSFRTWFYDSNGNPLFQLWLDDNELRATGSSGSTVVGNFGNDNWHHVRVDFECGDGGYMGLSPDYYTIYGDGVEKISNSPFGIASGENISYIAFYTRESLTMEVHIDAIGYSWDPNYNIGDNAEEGMLLSFESSSAYDWYGYSLNRQDYKIILGNTTIPAPINGTHSILVFGKLSGQPLYSSEEVYFTVDIAHPSEEEVPIFPIPPSPNGNGNGKKKPDYTIYIIIATFSIGLSAGLIYLYIRKMRRIKSELPRPETTESD